MKTKKKTPTLRKRAPFVLPLFSPEVTEKLEAIKAKMQFWHQNYELAVMIRAMVGEDHHPALWTLAAMMLDFEEQAQGRSAKNIGRWRDGYPICRSDIEAIKSHPNVPADMLARATTSEPLIITLEEASKLGVWQRAREQVQGDIVELLSVATSVADSYFFKCWGNVCHAIAIYSFNVQRVSGSREWKNGKWVSDIKWDSLKIAAPRPQAKRLLVIEIVKARQQLWFELNKRRPTNPEVAEWIIREREKRGVIPKKFDPKKFVKTVATTSKRLGFSTCVIERKVKNGDKSE